MKTYGVLVSALLCGGRLPNGASIGSCVIALQLLETAATYFLADRFLVADSSPTKAESC
jgi:hypothetical protein